MKKTESKYTYGKIINCPICKSKTFDYVFYTEECWGIVEQHGYCDRCGYTLEQAYSPVFEAFWDVERGFKHPGGYYVPKNVKKHKRIRRKLGIKNIEVNPRWIYYF